MKHQIVKKLTTLTAAFALCAGLAGCQTGVATNIDADAQNGVPQQEQPTDTLASNENGDALSMGRYVEKQVDLEDAIEAHSYMIRDGENIKVLPYGHTIYTSEDNGESWKSEVLDSYAKLEADGNYIMCSAIASDGTLAVQYSPTVNEEDTSDDAYSMLNPHLMIIYPDGTSQEIPVEFSRDDLYARSLHFTEDGRLLMTTFNKCVYEVDVSTGALNKICTYEDNAMYITSQGKLLLLPTYGGILLYDMENERFVEDSVFADFIKDTYGEPNDYGSCYNLYAFFGEENVIYVAGDKGLHRHVIDGSAVEQVIDADLSSFGNPSRQIVHAMMLENEAFLAHFVDGSLVKFYYDAAVPTVPNEKLLVYSLENNDTVRQAIAAYQTANPEMYVEYEVALSGDGVTREDALKNLSTKLLNGEGPDVLILDNMPIDTYVEKGILLDISDILEEVKNSEGLYENLVAPFQNKDGSIYVTPMEFQLPLIMGESAYVEKSKDYKGYAQSIVELRAANPEGLIIRDCNETGITMRHTPVCAAAWKNEDGSINESSIREFLELTKQISDAQMSGVSQKEISDYGDLNIFRGGYGDGTNGKVDWGFYFKMIDCDSFVYRGTKMASGNTYSMIGLAEVLSMPRNEGCEQLSIDLFDGQSKNVYMPETMTGINAQGKNTEAAKAFVKLMLSQEIQTSTFRGLPINKTAFDLCLNEHDDTRENDEPYMMYGGTDNEGNYWDLDAWWFSEEQKQLIKGWASAAKTPYVRDTVLENAVQNACVEYLKGRVSLDGAVADVLKSTAIYMAE